MGMMAAIVKKAKMRVLDLSSVLKGMNGLFNWVENENVLDSIFINALPHLDQRIWMAGNVDPSEVTVTSNMFPEALAAFLQQFTSICDVSTHIEYSLLMAQRVLNVDAANALKALTQKESKRCVLQDSLRSILSGSPDGAQVAELFVVVIQMIFARSAAVRLIQMATPESIFTNR